MTCTNRSIIKKDCTTNSILYTAAAATTLAQRGVTLTSTNNRENPHLLAKF